jgi:hypothetical protein
VLSSRRQIAKYDHLNNRTLPMRENRYVIIKHDFPLMFEFTGYHDKSKSKKNVKPLFR